MRLIDADEFIEDLKAEHLNLFFNGMKGTPRPMELSFAQVVERVDCVPIIDAVPVVHGEWSDGADIIEARLHRHYFRCKVCHKFADSFVGGTENWWCSEKPNYCPNCGAKMDGGNENADD